MESFLGGIFLGSFGNTTQAVRSAVQNSFQHGVAIPNPNILAIEQVQKNAVPGGTTVTVSSGSPVITEKSKQNSTLAHKLASNLDTVRDMIPVTALTGVEFNNRNIKLSDQIADFFKSLGNKVVRTGFGDVHLGEYGVGGMINHRPLNRAKMVSLAAAPDVIQNGRQISYEPNWKNRGYESYIFAAPVTVNGVTVYVAAVVDKRPNNKFYLSEMVDLNGNYVRIEESPSGNAKNGVTDGARISDRSGITARPEGLSEGGKPSATNAEPTPLFDNSISQPVQNVNPATIQQQLASLSDLSSLTGEQQHFLQRYQQQLQDTEALRTQVQSLQQRLEQRKAKGQSAGWLMPDQKRAASLDRLLQRWVNTLRSMESSPLFRQLSDMLAPDSAPESAYDPQVDQTVENRRKKDVENNRTYVRIYSDGDVITDGSHIENGKLKPNITYQTGEHAYLYSTNADGLISRVYVDELYEKVHDGRLEHDPNTYGKQAGDHAGHLIGDRFGGSPELDNLVSQAALVNLSKYKKIGNQWGKALKAGKKVSVSIAVNYDGGTRPVSFVVEYTIDGTSYKSDIPNE